MNLFGKTKKIFVIILAVLTCFNLQPGMASAGEVKTEKTSVMGEKEQTKIQRYGSENTDLSELSKSDEEDFIYGSYPQSSDGNNEPVRWIVLDVLEDGSILAVSRYALCNSYTGFSLNITAGESESYTYTTKILSKSEIEKYSLSYCRPTEYAKNHRVAVSNDGYCSWWATDDNGNVKDGHIYSIVGVDGKYTLWSPAGGSGQVSTIGYRPAIVLTPTGKADTDQGQDQDGSKFAITDAGLYTREGQTDSKIETLNYAAGNFYYDTGTAVDIEDPSTTDYDCAYLSFTAKLERTESTLISTRKVTLSLPEGLSFSPDKPVQEKEKTIGFTAGSTRTIWEKVYFLYSEKYAADTSVQLTYSANKDSGDVALCNLHVVATTDNIPLIEQDREGDFYHASLDKSMFEQDTSSYQSDAALFSAYLANMIECSDKPTLRLRIKSDLMAMGFSHIKYSGSSDPLINSGLQEEYVCATKKIVQNSGKVETVLIYAIQGSDVSGDENDGNHATVDWLGDFSLGIQADVGNKYHENFNTCIENNYDSFLAYLSEQKIEKNDSSVRMVVTGHSRGAAIANGVGAKIGDDNLFSGHVFCYTYAAPNIVSASAATKAYDYIYNVINKYDAVPYVPANFYKYGSTLVIREGGPDAIVSNHNMTNYISGVRKHVFETGYAEWLERCKETSITFDRLRQDSDDVMSLSTGIKYSLIRNLGNRLVNMIRCPVNAEVIDGDGNSVCGIVDDQIIYCLDKEVYALVNGEDKIICYPSKEGYALRIIGYADGMMDYTCAVTDEQGNDQAVYNFHDVTVADGEVVMTARDEEAGVIFEDKNDTKATPDEVFQGDTLKGISVTLDSNIEDVTLSGGGYYTKGDYVCASFACGRESAVFLGWYDEGDQLISGQKEFCWGAEKDIKLTAKFCSQHRFGEWETTEEPTCRKTGAAKRVCTDCGYSETVELDMVGHTYDSGTITTEPSADAPGVKTYICTVCGAAKTENIPRIVHADKSATTVSLTNKSVFYNGKVQKIGNAVVNGSTGRVTYIYYTNKACTEKTSRKNSGSVGNGSAPRYAGTYYVKANVEADDRYRAAVSAAAKFTIRKVTPKISIKTTSKTYQRAAVRKKEQSYSIVLKTVSDGKVTYKKVKSSSKKIRVTPKGKIRIAKGAPAGTYTIKVRITTAKTRNCNKNRITKTFKIRVK